MSGTSENLPPIQTSRWRIFAELFNVPQIFLLIWKQFLFDEPFESLQYICCEKFYIFKMTCFLIFFTGDNSINVPYSLTYPSKGCWGRSLRVLDIHDIVNLSSFVCLKVQYILTCQSKGCWGRGQKTLKALSISIIMVRSLCYIVLPVYIKAVEAMDIDA